MIVKMIKNLENKMEKMQESMNNDLEDLMNKHTNNTITEMRNTLEGINSRISEAERISGLEDKMVEMTSEEQNKVKRMKRKKEFSLGVLEKETSNTISLKTNNEKAEKHCINEGTN